MTSFAYAYAALCRARSVHKTPTFPMPTTVRLAAAIFGAPAPWSRHASVPAERRGSPAPTPAAVSASIGIPGQQHLHRPLAPDGPAQRDHGRTAEKADAYAGRRKASLPGEATARSQAATNWHPAAVATPATSAMTGCGIASIRAISGTQASKIDR